MFLYDEWVAKAIKIRYWFCCNASCWNGRNSLWMLSGYLVIPYLDLGSLQMYIYGWTYTVVKAAVEYQHTRLLVYAEIVHSQTDVTEAHRCWWAWQGMTRVWLYYPYPQGVGLDSPAWLMCRRFVTLVFNVALYFLTERHCTESGPAYCRVMAIWLVTCERFVTLVLIVTPHILMHRPWTGVRQSALLSREVQTACDFLCSVECVTLHILTWGSA